MAECLLIDVDGGVATVTMNRPEARNALDARLRSALHRSMAELDADDAVWVVVLTGAEPAFCAGLDLREIARGDHDLAATVAVGPPDAQGERALPAPWSTLGKPLIGAVNGVAVAGGLEVALRCDFLVASDRARFADTHVRVGVQPGWGLTVHLAEAVGVRRAREMSATGNFVDAATALAWGLVNHVVPHDDLLPFARSLAADIASNDAAGVARIFRTYREVAGLPLGDALRHEADVAGGWLLSRRPVAAEVAQRVDEVAARGRSQAG